MAADQKLAFSKEYFLNVASLLHQVLYERSEDGVGDGRISVGQGSSPSGLMARDTNRYSVNQTKSEERISLDTKAWNSDFRSVLNRVVSISRGGKDTLDAVLASGGCLDNHIEGSIVEYLRDQGFTVSKQRIMRNSEEGHFVNVLYSAVKHQLANVVDLCLEKGVGDLDFALYLAVQSTNSNIVRKILSKYSRGTPTILYEEALLSAVQLRYEYGIQALLEVEPNMTQLVRGCSALLCKVVDIQANSLDIIKVFLNCIGNINISDSVRCTALHYAAEHTSEELVDFVVSKGADLEASSAIGDTPLMYAGKNDKVFTKLIGLGANMFHKNHKGQTTLHMDCSRTVVGVSLEQGLGVNTQDIDGNTPLHMAFSRASGVAEVLLANGASVHVTNRRGETVVETFKTLVQRSEGDIYTHNRMSYVSRKTWQIREEFLEALIKLKVAEVRDLTQEFGVTEEECESISTSCLAELERMKQAMFGHTSLYDVAFKPDPIYASNQLLRDTMDETNLRSQFPMYFPNILEGFAKAERRNAFFELVEEFSQVMAMSEGRPGVVLPGEMSKIILARLGMADLVRLRQALGLSS